MMIDSAAPVVAKNWFGKSRVGGEILAHRLMACSLGERGAG